MGFDAAFSQKLAARGWVGVTLQAAYGGASLDAFSRFVLVEELLAAGAPVSAHWIADRQSGPLIMKFGTEAQRQFYLPKICAAEASLHRHERTQCRLRPRQCRQLCDTLRRWLAFERPQDLDHQCAALPLHDRPCAFSGEPQDRQTGLSQFIVDLSLPGVTVRPIHDLDR